MRKFLLSAAAVTLTIGVVQAQFKVQGIERAPRSASDMFMPDEGTPVNTTEDWTGTPSFDDIKQWYGHGSKRAAMLIQFSVDGETHSRLLGYRFDGTVLCGEAWAEIAQKDPHLVIFYETSSGFGGTVQGFGWDGNADGFSITNANGDVLTAENGVIFTGGYDGDGWTAVGDDDTWCSGWMKGGYWSYWWSSDISQLPGYSGVGAFGNTLEDGMIDAWIWLPNFDEAPLKPWAAVDRYLPQGWTTSTICKDGLYYRLQSAGTNEVDFIAPTPDAMNAEEGKAAYSGDIIVPATVELNGKMYTVTYVDDNIFKGTAVTSVSFPECITTLYDEMFAGCTELTEIDMPGLETMGKSAFKGCAKLANVPFPKRYFTIPESYAEGTAISEFKLMSNVSVGSNAFRGTQLTDIVIPIQCGRIGSGSFNCETLRSVKVEGSSVPVISDDTFSETTYNDGTLTVALGYEDLFKEATGWSKFMNVETYGEPLAVGQYFYVDNIEYKVVAGETPSVSVGGLQSTSYNGEITIPRTVTFQKIEYNIVSLEKSAFSGSKITGVTIQDNITTLPERCFYNASALASVILPEGLSEIGGYCFYGSKALSSIDLPSSLNTLGDWAFYNSGLTSITLPENLVNLGQTALGSCTSLESVIFNNRPTSIPYQFLTGCRKLPSIDFPESVTSFGANAVSGCEGLTSFTFPKGVTEIPSSMFSSCEGLTEIIWPDNLQSIGSSAFYQCRALETITIPEGISELAINTFQRCYKLKEINLPSTLTKIGAGCFSNCSALTTFAWPETVNEIPDNCFYYCSALESIEIPESVISIGKTAFSTCSSLASVTIPSGITSIRESTFGGCKALTGIDIPSSVTSIEKSSFNGCTGLTEIVIPDNVTTLGEMAFAYCYGLTKVTIGEGITELPNNCFVKDRAITEITLPSCLEKIGTSALSGLSTLKSLTLPSSLKEIGSNAFADNRNMSTLVIPENVQTIGSNFIKNSYISSVYMLTPQAPVCENSGVFNYSDTYSSSTYAKFPKLTVLPFTKSSYTAPAYTTYSKLTITEVKGSLTLTESKAPYAHSEGWRAEGMVNASHSETSTSLAKMPAQFVDGLTNYLEGIKLKFQYRPASAVSAIAALETEDEADNNLVEFEADQNGIVRLMYDMPKGQYEYRWVAKSGDTELKSSDWNTFTIENDVITGIEEINASDEDTVDVYSMMGVCLMKGVGMKDALSRLNPGVYIVNGRKIYIK